MVSATLLSQNRAFEPEVPVTSLERLGLGAVDHGKWLVVEDVELSQLSLPSSC